MRKLSLCALVALLAPIAPARAAFPEGSAHLEDVRVFTTFEEPYRIVDLSLDGRYAIYSQFSEVGNEVGIIDLIDETIEPLADFENFSAAWFSPDAETILIREGRVLRLLDVSDGAITKLGQSPPKYSERWLDDGRAAWFDMHGRLKTIVVGETPEEAGYALPVTQHRETAALNGDASAVVRSKGCEVKLTEIGGETISFGRRLTVPPRSWSPDAEHFVLQRVSYDGCKAIGAPPVHDILFERDGTKLGRILKGEALSHGHSLYWSQDSRWLLIASQWTGSQVEGIRPLYALSMEDMTVSLLIGEGLTGGAFVGPGDWIVYSLFDHPGGGASSGDRSGATYVARLVP